MISRSQCRKLLGMGFLMAVAFMCLGYRLVDLQVRHHEKFREEAENATRQMFLRAPKRGEIRDIRGNLLAASVFVKTVIGNPALIGHSRAEVAQTIAPLLQMSESEIYRRLEPRVKTDDRGRLLTNQYVVLKRKVPVETWEQIKAAMMQLPRGVKHRDLPKAEQRFYDGVRTRGVDVEQLDDQIRVYPNRSLAAHVLGFVGTGVADSPKGKVYQLDGKDGVESALNEALQGVVGWRSTEVARRRELVTFRNQDIEALPGRNVILTLDAGVQHIVEAELAEVMRKHTPVSASAVVVRPGTGEILAMATLPSFDPNDLTGTLPEWRRNRVITDLVEPGSTFKIVVVSGALNEGLVSLDDRIDCENGVFVFAGKALRDTVRHDILTVEEIVKLSSNIGSAKIGIRMGSQRLYQYMRDYGFGSKTGIPLVGEISGLVHPVHRWSKLSISRIPIGHEIGSTPLQMVMAMCAVANGGRLMRPMLVDRLEDSEGRVLIKNHPHVVRQVVSESAAKQTVTALKTVVSTNGTGRRAMLPHYSVGGKTGTARKLVGGYYRRDKHFSSFIGFFPADDPEVCVAVYLDEPKNGYYGGEAAAPVFRNIAERVGKYLAIPPDLEPQESLVAAGATGLNRTR